MAKFTDQQSARDVLIKTWKSIDTGFGIENPGKICASCRNSSEIWLSTNNDSLPYSISAFLSQIKSQNIHDILQAQNDSACDERKNAVSEQINLLTKHQLSLLDIDDKRILLKEIRTTAMSSAQMTARRKLYKSFSLDPNFVAWDDKKREELIKKLKENKELLEARKKWKSLTNDERIEILTKVASIQAKIYGSDEVPITLKCYSKPNGEDNTSYNGGYDLGTEEIGLNMNNKSMLDSFSESINVIVHESAHRMQHELAAKYYNKQLSVTDERYIQAKIFYTNWVTGGYVNLDEDPSVNPFTLGAGYKNQPVEVHARKTGDAVGAALEGSMWDKFSF